MDNAPALRRRDIDESSSVGRLHREFIRAYDTFVQESGIPPERERALRQILADMQAMLASAGGEEGYRQLSDFEQRSLVDLSYEVERETRARIKELLTPDEYARWHELAKSTDWRAALIEAEVFQIQ